VAEEAGGAEALSSVIGKGKPNREGHGVEQSGTKSGKGSRCRYMGRYKSRDKKDYGRNKVWKKIAGPKLGKGHKQQGGGLVA